MVRLMHNFGTQNAFELGAGGAAGERGSRAMMAVRKELVKEDVNFPSLNLRFSGESYADAELQRRNAAGAGLLLTQGFSLSSQEVYAFIHPRAQIALESTSNEFVVVSAATLGLNTQLSQGKRKWIGSMEFDLGLQNAASSFMLGIATDL
jgi:hypothetical protein